MAAENIVYVALNRRDLGVERGNQLLHPRAHRRDHHR